jgi:hypothetical protein
MPQFGQQRDGPPALWSLARRIRATMPVAAANLILRRCSEMGDAMDRARPRMAMIAYLEGALDFAEQLADIPRAKPSLKSALRPRRGFAGVFVLGGELSK